MVKSTEQFGTLSWHYYWLYCGTGALCSSVSYIYIFSSALSPFHEMDFVEDGEHQRFDSVWRPADALCMRKASPPQPNVQTDSKIWKKCLLGSWMVIISLFTETSRYQCEKVLWFENEEAPINKITPSNYFWRLDMYKSRKDIMFTYIIGII